jgi:apolipoprotein N-acyltransferase
MEASVMHLGFRTAVTVLGAAFLSLCVAPWEIAWTHWFAYLPLFWVLREETPRANRWLLLLYGSIAELIIYFWITETVTLFSNIPFVGAVAINLLFGAVYGLPYLATFAPMHAMRRRLGDGWMLALPCWAVVVEWLALKLILFPYNQGVSQYRTPAVWQLASVTGIWGISWLLIFVNATLGESVYRLREGRRLPYGWLAAAGALLGATLAFGTWRYQAVEAELASAPVKRVQQVQSPYTMQERLGRRASDNLVFWANATAELPPGAADLVVWPEGACPYQLNEGATASALWRMAIAGGFDMIVGAGTREREGDKDRGEDVKVRIFNSVYAFQRSRLEVPARTPQDDWASLRAMSCDLGRGHVFTWPEAAVLAEVGEATGDDPACAAKLRAREAELGARTKASEALRTLQLSDRSWWSRARTYTSRRAEPGDALGFVEALVMEKSKPAVQLFRDAQCRDGDCLTLTWSCEAGVGCEVFPEAEHYDKMVPLPFGEYLPLGETFPWLNDWIEGPGNFRAGTEPVVFDVAGVRASSPICYEGILGYVCDRYESPDMLVNVTNDAWFGDTPASALHGMLVTVRAIELGVPVVRSAYSGVSFVVEPHGRIVAETSLFTQVNRVVDVRVKRVWTLYSVWGDWFVLVSALGVAAAAWRARGRA